MSNQAGKGDKPRPTNKSTYDSNFDKIKWSQETKQPRTTKKGKTTYKY
jgi:hypothetical protein